LIEVFVQPLELVLDVGLGPAVDLLADPLTIRVTAQADNAEPVARTLPVF
jgi:hypothetical protein